MAQDGKWNQVETWEGKTKRDQIWAPGKMIIIPHPAFKFMNKYPNIDDIVFATDISDAEKIRFYDYLTDTMSTRTFDELVRFDRSKSEITLSKNILTEKEKRIENLLHQCVDLVGATPQDKFLFDVQGNPIEGKWLHHVGPKLSKLVKHNKMSPFVFKCQYYIYPSKNPDNDEYYNIGDFGYKYNFNNKQKKVEELYVQIYLNIKNAGLLRQMDYAFYPKVFLRQHADATGLTGYINKEGKKASKKLNHDELAAQYFGSYDKWLKSLDAYIDTNYFN